MSAIPDPDDVASVTINLKIIEGKELVAKDRSLLGKRTTSDPFVEVFLGDKNYGHKTKVIKTTLDPKWNESFKIFVTGDHARDIIRCVLASFGEISCLFGLSHACLASLFL